MRLVDSHCHLDSEAFDEDRDEVLRRGRASGVETILAINTAKKPEDLDSAIRLAENYDGVWATVGVQPHDADKAGAEVYARMEELARHPIVVAVGETGLEYHYEFVPRPAQREAFIRQMRIAGAVRKPIVIHTREAWDDTFALLEEHWRPYGLAGIMHCFTGGPKEAERCLEMGFYLSFSGILTYKSANGIREAARLAPIERILIETDAPLLAPLLMRGKRNEPAYVLYTALALAEARGESLEQVSEAVSANFGRLCLRGAEASGYTG
jgi:TatD DNase family protein